MSDLNSKYHKLIAQLGGLKSCAVAFSGGVDSCLLAYAAHEALGKRAIAITFQTPYIPSREIDDAVAFAAGTGMKQKILSFPLPDEILRNPDDRCYRCKKKLFTALIEWAATLGFQHVLDGTNLDDDADYRPGRRALAELGVRSPLAEVAFTKDEIRTLSRQKGLPLWDKPAFACLLSRIPHHAEVNGGLLRRIEQAEDVLIRSGFKQVRVRHHGDLARIEVPPEDRSRFFDEALMESISGEIRSLGYRYVCLDMDGYRTGRMNPPLLEK